MKENVFIEINSGYLKLEGVRNIKKTFNPDDLTSMYILVKTGINTQASLILRGCFNKFLDKPEPFFIVVEDTVGKEIYEVELNEMKQAEFYNEYKIKVIGDGTL